MSKDLVTRLLQHARFVLPNSEDETPTETVLIEAANEIERLQTEVNTWMGVAERFAESDPKFEAFRFYFRARTKAMRGE